MAMAASSFSFCRSRNINPSHFPKTNSQFSTLARSQSFRDEGNFSNTVDANMSVLRHRMDQVRMKERKSSTQIGWNYNPRYDAVWKRRNLLFMSLELLSIVVSTIGLVFIMGSLCIFILALIFN